MLHQGREKYCVGMCRPEATVDPHGDVSGGPDLSGVHVVVHQLRVSQLLHSLCLETPCTSRKKRQPTDTNQLCTTPEAAVGPVRSGLVHAGVVDQRRFGGSGDQILLMD